MMDRSSSRLMTIDEVADSLGTSRRHLRRLIAERRIPYCKVGHLVRFDPTEVAAWLDANRRPAEGSVDASDVSQR